MIRAVTRRAADSQRSAPQQPFARGNEGVRVLIADHDGLARSMMRAMLNDAGGVDTASAADSREALELMRSYRPTVLIVDAGLPPEGGAELIRKVLREFPETRVLSISADDPETALAGLRAGAIGHLSKDVDPRELAPLVLRAAAGEAIVARRLIMPLLELLRELPDAGWRPLHSRLTTREWQIIDLLRGGASTHEIADRLVVSPTTIYSHIKSLLRKLGVHSRHEAVLAADRLRLEESTTTQGAA
jgi:DNA-binding NarL/FixJ family response regulator